MKNILLILSVLVLRSDSAEIYKRSDGRIAGGRPAALGEIPHFALVQMIEGATGTTFQCGGSLIRLEEFVRKELIVS